jgi:hypothetical protein
MINELSKIRSPFAKVVVHIDDRNAGAPGALLKRADMRGRGQNLTRQNVTALELKSLITSISNKATLELSGAFPCRSGLSSLIWAPLKRKSGHRRAALSTY